jgi:hypothetical protein
VTRAPEIVEARRHAAIAALIAFFGEGAIAFVDAKLIGFGPLSIARFAHSLVAAIALAILARRRCGVRGAEVAFLMIAIPFIPVLFIGEHELIAAGALREQWSWYKLVMLGIASLAPGSPWLPALVCAALAVQAIVLRFALARVPTTLGEPWITAIFAGIAIGMLVSRARRREAAARAARVVAYAAALERMTAFLSRVRDRANSPLQTIDLGATLIANRCPSEQRITSAMQNAVVRLRRLSTTLTRATLSTERASRAIADASAPKPARPRRARGALRSRACAATSASSTTSSRRPRRKRSAPPRSNTSAR